MLEIESAKLTVKDFQKIGFAVTSFSTIEHMLVSLCFCLIDAEIGENRREVLDERKSSVLKNGFSERSNKFLRLYRKRFGEDLDHQKLNTDFREIARVRDLFVHGFWTRPEDSFVRAEFPSRAAIAEGQVLDSIDLSEDFFERIFDLLEGTIRQLQELHQKILENQD